MKTQTNYWGRMFIGGEWGIWHKITQLKDGEHPVENMKKGTKLTNQEIEITIKEPNTYAGKNA